MDHNDFRRIAEHAGQLLLAEFSLFLLPEEQPDPARFAVTAATVRAVLAAAETWRAKQEPPTERVNAPGATPANPYGVTVVPLDATGPIVITDVPRLEGNRAKNGAAPAQAVTAGALDDAPADWPAKLLAAGLDNGEARIVAQLDAGKTVWRAVRRDAQRRIVYALIRHLTAVGEAATIKRYDAARPAWLPSAALLYQQFDEKWSETVAAALEACPESKGGIDAPSGAPFRG